MAYMHTSNTWCPALCFDAHNIFLRFFVKPIDSHVLHLSINNYSKKKMQQDFDTLWLPWRLFLSRFWLVMISFHWEISRRNVNPLRIIQGWGRRWWCGVWWRRRGGGRKGGHNKKKTAAKKVENNGRKRKEEGGMETVGVLRKWKMLCI